MSSLDEIQEKREKVRKEFLTFENVQPTTTLGRLDEAAFVNSKNILKLMRLYDQIFFAGWFREKFSELGVSLRVIAEPGLENVSSIVFGEDIKIYFNSYLLELQAVKQVCKDLIDCLQYFVEQNLIHLSIILLGKISSTKYNLIFGCLSIVFFGKATYWVEEYDKKRKPMYGFGEKDCPAGLVLAIMFLGSSDFWLNAINSTIEYNTVRGICDSEINVNQLKKLASEIKDQIYSDLEYIRTKDENAPCQTLKALFETCISNFPTKSIEIYNALCLIFPSMQIPYFTKIGKGKTLNFRPYFSMQEFLLGSTPPVLWDKMEFPVLVFYNAKSPFIADFSAIKINGRMFGKNILLSDSHFYVLTGAIMLHTIKGQSNYVSFYLKKDSNWYYQNETKGGLSLRIYQDIDVFSWKIPSIPVMYFYQKIDRDIIIRKENYTVTLQERNLYFYKINVETSYPKKLKNFYREYQQLGKLFWEIPFALKEKFLEDLDNKM